MGIITGLKSIQQATAPRETTAKTNWLTVDPGKKVELIFLQELDESSPRYSEKNGLGFMIAEHNSPSKGEFWKRVACTNDEEHDFQCWACEKNKAEWAKKKAEDTDYTGGWGRKMNLYINVLVRSTDSSGEKTEEVAVLQRKAGGWIEQLIELATEDGFISNRLFTLSRKGEGFDTTYTFTHRKEDAGVNVEDYELFDIESLVREVPYGEQAAALGVKTAPKRVDLSDSASDPEDEDDDDWL